MINLIDLSKYIDTCQEQSFPCIHQMNAFQTVVDENCCSQAADIDKISLADECVYEMAISEEESSYHDIHDTSDISDSIKSDECGVSNQECKQQRVMAYRSLNVSRSGIAVDKQCGLGNVKREATPIHSEASNIYSMQMQGFLRQNLQEESFSDMVLRMIDERGYKDSDVYKAANIDRRHFSKIRSNRDYHPTKSTVFAICMALKLSLAQSTSLLAAAGYCYCMSSRWDIIIMYHVERGIYSIMELNLALSHFNEPLIGY